MWIIVSLVRAIGWAVENPEAFAEQVRVLVDAVLLVATALLMCFIATIGGLVVWIFRRRHAKHRDDEHGNRLIAGKGAKYRDAEEQEDPKEQEERNPAPPRTPWTLVVASVGGMAILLLAVFLILSSTQSWIPVLVILLILPFAIRDYLRRVSYFSKREE
ncbi:MAG: hypothetical protein N2C14_27800 [Planctomycetales bacterium]